MKNGNTEYDEICAAIKEAKSVTEKPTLIKVINYNNVLDIRHIEY